MSSKANDPQHCQLNVEQKQNVSHGNGDNVIRHGLHFVLTLLTFGLWGMVWWWLILKYQGKKNQWLSGFDDDYWSYLMERDQPPASLYPLNFDGNQKSQFEA